MKTYLLSMIHPSGDPPSPEFLSEVMAEVGAIRRELESEGAWVFGGGLEPPGTAVVVRPKGGEAVVTDGPFVESKEHLGGFTILRAPDLDAALEWARRYARATTLPIEVRRFRG